MWIIKKFFKCIWNFSWWLCYGDSYDEWREQVKEAEQNLLEELLREEKENDSD